MRAWLVAILVTAVPAVARACPVCFDANEQNRAAFIVTTILLSTLPLAMVGVIVLWIRDSARGPEAGERSTSGAPASDPLRSDRAREGRA